MTRHLLLAATALTLVLAPLGASAHHRAGHDGGAGGEASQGNRGGNDGARGSGRGTDDDAIEDGEEEAAGGNHPCAWGLADRDVPCVPPGQAAKGVTTNDWIGTAESVFTPETDFASVDNFGLITNAEQLGLPALEDPTTQAYALAGDAIILVDVATGTDANGVTTTTYTYDSTVRRAAFPGGSNR